MDCARRLWQAILENGLGFLCGRQTCVGKLPGK